MFKILLRVLLSTVLLLLTMTPTVAYQLHGLNFSPYTDGSDPNLGAQIDEAQLAARLEVVKPYTQWVRTFGRTLGMEKAGSIAKSQGFKTALSAWIGRDTAANETEIANLINAGKAGQADLVIVGSEVLLRGDLSEQALIDYINRVKQRLPGIPVAYADIYSVLIDHPNIIRAVDVIFANYYPYWEKVAIDQAIVRLQDMHQRMLAAAGGKPVVVSETGWPSDGASQGNAIASLTNANQYFQKFISWANANNVDYFYFEAFDEPYKAKYEGSQGAHWGLWDSSLNLKPGMDAILSASADIQFTFVPPYGSSADLRGIVLHVQPTDYRVAVYINVSGKWWTKPTAANPITTIQSDGSWVCDITTGGSDTTATRIAAFLIPAGYNPTVLLGAVTLPTELTNNAIASRQVERSPTSTWPVYRFNTGTYHFYTISESEKDDILQNMPGWKLEGIAYLTYAAPYPGALPVYRFNTGTYHFYTISEEEKNNILHNYPQWKLEGIAYYADSSSGKALYPVYRFNTSTYHFYTISEEEKNNILANFSSWALEGIAFYAYLQ